MNNEKVINVLNDLIEICRDGQVGFLEAAEAASSLELKSFLNDVSRNRGQIANALSAELLQFGGKKEPKTTGVLERVWVDFKGAAGLNDQSIVTSAETAEDVTVRTFKKALEEPLPSHLPDLILGFLNEIKDTHDRIRLLRDAWPERTQYKTAGRD